jgi:protein-disulfide isomerase
MEEQPSVGNPKTTQQVTVRPAILVIVTAVIFFVLGYGASWFAFNSVLDAESELAQTVENAVNAAFAEYTLGQGAAVAGVPQATAVPEILDISVDDDPALGPEDAPITIVEFSDFRCGFCGRFHTQTFRPLLDQYEGQIRFVYRDFPVVGGELAALAAECVHEQGEDVFWQYHELLFANQQTIGEASKLSELAGTLDLDQEAFQVCVESGATEAEIQADFAEGMAYGVRGTPAFFINGRAVIGAQPLAVFQQIIDEELAALGAN